MAFDFNEEAEKPVAWLGYHSNVTVATFLHLARNVAGHPFPENAKKDSAREVRKLFTDCCGDLKLPKGITVFDLAGIPDSCRKMLEERLMIFTPLPRKEDSLLAISGNSAVSILVNQQNHFLFRSITPGNRLKKLLKPMLTLAKRAEEKIPFAFHRKYGYLTADPADTGTGLHAGAMFHLPALALDDSIGQILHGMDRLGFLVHRESPEDKPDSGFYTVVTSGSLGETEEEITERMNSLVTRVEECEKNARVKLMRERGIELHDRIARAYGQLRYGYTISSEESLEKLSMLRLGIDLKLFSKLNFPLIDILTLQTRTGHLIFRIPKQLSSTEIDCIRASLIRFMLKPDKPGKK